MSCDGGSTVGGGREQTLKVWSSQRNGWQNGNLKKTLGVGPLNNISWSNNQLRAYIQQSPPYLWFPLPAVGSRWPSSDMLPQGRGSLTLCHGASLYVPRRRVSATW